MDKTKHPVDDLFSKGIEGFQMEPSPDIKKKVFASPAAIKPIKPWFIGINWMLITVSVIATASLIFYFGFYYNGQLNTISDLKNNVNTNTTIENENKQSLSSVSDNNLDADGSTPLNINSSKQIGESKVENNAVVNNIKTNDVVEENAVSKQITNTKGNKNQNVVDLSLTPPSIKTDNLQKSDVINTNKQKITKQDANIENNITASLIAGANSSEKSINDNLEENYTNTSFSSNLNATVNPSSNVTLNTELDKSSILFLMDKKFIKLNPEQCSEYMKLFIEKPAHYNKGLWYAEIKAGAFVSKYKVNSKSDEFKPAADAKQELLKPAIGYEFGANAVYQRNKLIFKAGISYNNYGEKLSGNLLLTNPHNSEQINFVNNPYDVMLNGNYYNYDTLGSYYHYTYTQTDIIIKTDSVLAWHVQKVLVDMYDTTNVTKFDTISKTNINNSIRYFEVPLSFGSVFPLGRFNIAVNANIAPGYLLAVRGWQMNTADYPAIEPYSKTTIQKFTLSAGVSFELGYMINESLTLIAEPYYKRSLLPMYSSKNNINQTNQNFGFRIGIRKLL